MAKKRLVARTPAPRPPAEAPPAFEAFFSGMPADTDGFGRLTAGPGMAFVLVQHLAPDHKSILTDLVKRYTRMQVFEVEDGMVVQPNCARGQEAT